MIRSFRIGLVALLLAGATIALSACGFRPLYGGASAGGSGATAEQLATVEIAVIADRPGQRLRGLLIRELNPRGRPADPAYRLDVQLLEERDDLGIQENDVATRANLYTDATMWLTDLSADSVVLTRELSTITSYNILIDEFATIANERDARERALQQIAEDIRLQLALHFDRQAQGDAARAPQAAR